MYYAVSCAAVCAMRTFGATEPLMYKLFPTLLASMGQAYPELKRAEGLIVDTLKNEETRFKKDIGPRPENAR